MKCPNCNTTIEDDYKFCPKCRFELNRFPEKKGPESPEFPLPDGTAGRLSGNHLSVVKNKAIWNIVPGEIARRISESEFADLEHLSGMIVEDGVTAIIHVDGKEVAQISGGIYDFVSDEKIEQMLERRAVDSRSLRGLLIQGWRSLVKAVCGEKIGEKIDPGSDDKYRTVGDIIRHLNGASKIAVYLKTDKSFPSLYGCRPEGAEGDPFVPMEIKTKFVDARIGVSMLLQIRDFRAFIREYLCNGASVTVSDIQRELESYVRNLLQEELKNEEIDEYGIPLPAKERISAGLKKLQEMLHGVEIVRVADITCSNDDFVRFRALSKEMYCSEKELDFLRRTNEFKNRLASVKNEQRLSEAKSDLELQKSLDEINKDGKLHEEELDQFYVLLSRQKRIREAKDSMEEKKALDDIRKTQLLNDDEFSALEEELKLRQFDRKHIGDAMRLNGLSALAKKRLDAEAELSRHKIEKDSEIEAAAFESYKQQGGRRLEAMDIEEAIYGKNYLAQRQHLQNELELSDIRRRHGNAGALEDADVEVSLLGKHLEGRKLEDDYRDGRSAAEYERERRREADRIEDLRRKQELSLSALERMNEMKEREREKEHLHKMDELHLTHREKMAALEAEKEMSSEKLFVKNLANLSGNEAASIYAASFGSKQEAEAHRREAEMAKEMANEKSQLYEKMMAMQQHSSEQNNNENKALMDKIMGFAERSMQTNASIVSSDAAHRDERERQQFERMERIAAQRISDAKEQKDEYREQMKHEQQRFDQNQDRALDYTTRVTEAGMRAPKEKIFAPYRIEPFGDTAFTLEQASAFIANGMITRRTIVAVNGTKRYAEEYPELSGIFEKCDFAVCPSCRKKVKKEKFCTECGAEL